MQFTKDALTLLLTLTEFAGDNNTQDIVCMFPFILFMCVTVFFLELIAVCLFIRSRRCISAFTPQQHPPPIYMQLSFPQGKTTVQWTFFTENFFPDVFGSNLRNTLKKFIDFWLKIFFTSQVAFTSMSVLPSLLFYMCMYIMSSFCLWILIKCIRYNRLINHI